jgi:outer membrane lipoprotein-sorting protein
VTDSASHSRAKWLLFLLALTAALFLVVASACGGDDDDDDGGDNGGATATESTDGGDDGGDETPTATNDDSGDDSSDEDIFSQLDDLTNELDSVTGQISYDITDADGSVSSMTFYAKPPNSRFDTTDGTTTSIIIYTPDSTYVCDSDTETCLATPSSGDTGALGLAGAFLGSDVLSAYVAVAEAAGADVNKSDESINGIDATCFSWDDTSTDIGKGKFCFNDAGVMIYQETTDDSGTSKLEATDYSGDVSDSVFDPPYEVTDLSDLGQ